MTRDPNATRASLRRDALRRELDREGAGYEFVQVVRLLQRLAPDREPVGGWVDPNREVARFSVPPTLAFPPSEVAQVRTSTDASPADVKVRVFALTGAQGVLPHAYTEHAAGRTRARDTAFRDFLDLFHHRLLSLFYRAWERHRPALAAERGEVDQMRAHLLDLVGVGTSQVQRTSPVPPDLLAYYAGLLAVRSRPAEGLAQIVTDHFNVTATVEQFVGEWRALPDGGQVCLGDDDADGTLGLAVVGNAVYDPHARVRLRVGPLPYEQFRAFLPGGEHYDRLRRLAAYYADGEVGVEAQLVLDRSEVPGTMLDPEDSPRLGMGAWLRVRPPIRDPDDVVLTLC